MPADGTPTSPATESDEQHYHQRQVLVFMLPDVDMGVSVTGVQPGRSVPMVTLHQLGPRARGGGDRGADSSGTAGPARSRGEQCELLH